MEFKPLLFTLPYPIYHIRIYSLGRGHKHKRILKKVSETVIKKVGIIYDYEHNVFKLLSLYFQSNRPIYVYPISLASKLFFIRVPTSTEYIIKKSLKVNDSPDKNVKLYLIGTLNQFSPDFNKVFSLMAFEQEIQRILRDKNYYKTVLNEYALKTEEMIRR